MARRNLVLTTLAAAILMTGCAQTPTARLATSAGALGTKAPAAPAPISAVIPGVALAPTVSVKAGAAPAVAAANVSAAQTATVDVVTADAQMEAIDLIAEANGSYAVQGWFGDLVDSVKRAWQRFKLKKEVKAALKHKSDKAFELYEGEIDNVKKNRTAPKTTINDLGGGGKEIVSTWDSTNKGTWAVETRRTVDADGTTQVLAVRVDGVSPKDLRVTTERVRTLIGDNGTYSVVTKQTVVYKDGRQERSEWTKTVDADGTEKLDGFITHRDGYRTEITGTRNADGKVEVQVSKIAPAHNPDPLPSASPWVDEDEADEDDEATSTPTPAPTATPAAQ